MKKTIFILIVLTSLCTHKGVISQDIPPPNPDLVINILNGQSIVFVFDEMSEYMNGIMNAGHVTFIRIGSIYDWKLQFNADQVMFYGTGNPSNTMALNNVGVIVTSVGTHQDDGTHLISYAKVVPLALESAAVTLLTKGSISNKGYALRNSFTLGWEIGTRRGNMNPIRMLEQNLGADTYNLNVVLTLSPVF